MAKLIVSRPSQSSVGFARIYQILIDGQRAASIGEGRKVEIPLSPGRHQVRARVGFMRSQPVEIEIDPEGVHYLAVRWNMSRRSPLTFVFLLTGLAQLGSILIVPSSGRLGAVITPLFILPIFLPIAIVIIWRDRLLCLEEIPFLDTATRQVAIPQDPPFRPRISIWQMMIVVAILALYLGSAMETSRRERARAFLSKARFHSEEEARYRGFELSWKKDAARFEKLGLDMSSFHQRAGRHAARADYHAAMRHKYEEAASRRWFFVEPDPPEPPWP